MTRTLILVAAVGLALAAATLSGAFSIAGGPFSLGEDGRVHRWAHGWGRHGFEASGGPTVERTLAWSGGDRLEIDVPADVTYTQGPETKLVVRGPQEALDRLEVRGGAISLHHDWYSGPRLAITLTAPDIKSFELNGSQSLKINGYSQDQLALDISGSAAATVAGTAKALDLDISGSGSADLTQLALQDAKVEISGSGSSKLAPTGAVKVDISGSGDVRLLSHPASLQTDISGSGHVSQPEAAAKAG